MFKFKKRKIAKQKQVEDLEINSVEEELYFLNEEIKKTPPGLKQNEYLKRRNEILMGKIPIDEFEQQHNIVEKMQEDNEMFEVSSSNNIQAVKKDGITKLFERERTIDNDFWKTYLDLDDNSELKNKKNNLQKPNIEKVSDLKKVIENNSFEKCDDDVNEFDFQDENQTCFDNFEKTKEYIDIPVYENKKFDEDQLKAFSLAQEIFKKQYSNNNKNKNNNMDFEDEHEIDVDRYFSGDQKEDNKNTNPTRDRMWEILKNQSLEKTLEALDKNEKPYDPGYKLYEDKIIKALSKLDDPLEK